MKSQCNTLLIATALVFYWILYSVTKLVVRVDQLNQWVDHNGWRWWLITVMEVAY
ncbi:putative B-cell receptor-associated protein [Helianthus annuus]|uniref:B-cell receptor-associated protein 29/31 n=1 Tax=Helianthus annuus TaxID=4232 RepID=A0A9K3H510_HELAN|nr:putative B-cell receptor-associated protein 29/31 [Helianthus annuus]KAJ0452984.1 putative B-cell receptor-associated protein [Helianthus annuus]KAJ0474900.1 putative B-cell receptor-associated protein [Helianthus annuus]KAJ0650455.1 putative B-cell receptor-associated protein [Helianthus annuus]KAJ0654209.1 putative B-cell receptor-associated protein [Helianthus annuus]